MKYSEIIPQNNTITDLKRIATIIKTDIGRTSDLTEITKILQKAKPQFVDSQRVIEELDKQLIQESSEKRLLSHIIIFEVLLNAYDHKLSCDETKNRVLAFEQTLINKSNELSITNLANGSQTSKRYQELELYNFVLDTAWTNNDELSPDEANLLSKLRERLKIHMHEHFILEAKLGRFPKSKDLLHSWEDVHNVRLDLQKAGILFIYRDENKICYDVIPDEIAKVIKAEYKIEIRDNSYKMLIGHKIFNKKPLLTKILETEEIDYSPRATIQDLKEKILMFVSPSVVLGANTMKCGLTDQELKKLLMDLHLKVSGTKQEKADNIINYYNNLKPTIVEAEDRRKIYYSHYEQLAGREYSKLRAKNIIEKDQDIDLFFEQATDYLFEKRLNLKPLEMSGNNHADGTLSMGENLVLWDNKSKEINGKDSGKIDLKDFLMKQFHTYMQKAEKPVLSFLVIAPDFTEESEVEAMQYKVNHGRDIVLITAKEIKELAEEWSKSKKKNDPFPLGYFNRPGRFNRILLGKI